MWDNAHGAANLASQGVAHKFMKQLSPVPLDQVFADSPWKIWWDKIVTILKSTTGHLSYDQHHSDRSGRNKPVNELTDQLVQRTNASWL